MGRIFYIMGKSSSGKDTIYNRLKEDGKLNLLPLVLYTTRPIRHGEVPGREYHFVEESEFLNFQRDKKVIESRTYETIYGPWTYFTADDGQMNLAEQNYLAIGTLESYEKMREYYGTDRLVPVYIEVEDGERLKRALIREELQKQPKYAEMCRRFLADAEDFSEENLKKAGIERRFCNRELETCMLDIKSYILSLQTLAKP